MAGRRAFCGRFAFDGNDPQPNARDDAAVAPDKETPLPGETAVFDGYTSCPSGINGIMVDFLALPDGATIGADDFEFRAGHGD